MGIRSDRLGRSGCRIGKIACAYRTTRSGASDPAIFRQTLPSFLKNSRADRLVSAFLSVLLALSFCVQGTDTRRIERDHWVTAGVLAGPAPSSSIQARGGHRLDNSKQRSEPSSPFILGNTRSIFRPDGRHLAI